MIPESFIQELLNRVDVVDVIDKSVPLKKAGANYSACCPFHNEKSPSFTVSPTKQFYHCFGCGAHGTAIGFVMEYQGLSFVEAIQDLAKMAGLTVPQEAYDPAKPAPKVVVGLQESLQQAANFYKVELKKSQRAIDYLKARGLSGQVAAKFQIGYAPAGWQNLQSIFPHYENEALTVAGLVVENDQGRRYDRFRDRIMFPIHDQKGQVIGFGGRVIDPEDTPKYYNSPETPLFQKGHELYGLFLARRAIRDAGRALVVEGYMDVIMVSQNGFENVAAVSGTALTLYQLKILKRYSNNLLISFDMDTAGSSGTKRGINLAQAEEFNIKIVTMPEGMDPADVLLKKPDLWSGLVAGAKSIMEFYLETALKEHDRETADGKKKIAAVLLPAIKVIANRVEQTFWIERLAKELRAREEDLRAEMEKAKADKAEVSSANNQPPVLEKNKSKKEILEKRLFVLLAKYPDKLSLIEGGDFFSPEAKIVFDFFKNNPDFIVNKNFPEEIAAFLNEVLFLSEAEEISAIEADRDFKKCLKELSRIALKDVLGRISKDIRIAEADDPEKAKQLLEEFNRLSKKLYDVEKS